MTEPVSPPPMIAPDAAPRDRRAPLERITRTLERAEELWLVYEHLHPFDRRSTPDLVFESERTVRRVRNFPAEWFRLPDDDLWALYAAR